MSAQPVDVLAVMDSAAQHAATLRTYARDTGAFRVTNTGASALAEACAAALAAIEARAAVAELVEVHAALLAEYGPNICSMRVDAPRRALWLRASAAHARVQGGAQ